MSLRLARRLLTDWDTPGNSSRTVTKLVSLVHQRRMESLRTIRTRSLFNTAPSRLASSLGTKKARVVPEDSVFIPGHMALRANPTLPTGWSNSNRINSDEMIKEICDRFYTLIDWSGCTGENESIRPRLTSKLKQLIEAPSTMSTDQAITYFDRLYWQEHSKFFINSVRVL